MKKLAVSLLIALLSLNAYAQEATSDEDIIFSVDPLENQSPANSGLQISHRDYQERLAQLRAAEKQKAFNLRGIELFEQAINDSAKYRMSINVDHRQTHTESKNIRSDRTSGYIAKGFAEQMRAANSGQRRTEDGAKVHFKCQQDSVLARLPVFRMFIKPGLCQLTLRTDNDEQRQLVTLSFVMELVDTDEHQNWPSKIISPEIELKVEAVNRN